MKGTTTSEIIDDGKTNDDVDRNNGDDYSQITFPNVVASINNGPHSSHEDGMAMDDSGRGVTVERGGINDNDDDGDDVKQKKKRGVCDVCMKPHIPNELLNLKQCTMCGVCVHELCYGMAADDGNGMIESMNANGSNSFVCHACKAIGVEVEANVPSRVGGPTLLDLLCDTSGIYSFTTFIREQRRTCNQQQQETNTDSERMIDFYAAVGSFTNEYRKIMMNNDDKVNAEEGESSSSSSMKKAAHQIYDNYCTQSSSQYITSLTPSIISDIESNIFNNDETTKKFTNKVFDNARRKVLASLECNYFEEYMKSDQYSTYLSSRRTRMTQIDRPVECVLCSVKSHIHAMHPLFDMPGKDGRQLVLPPDRTGPTFMRKGARLAWVHTLCAMFISANENYSGLVYGCDGDGNWEMQSMDNSIHTNNDDDYENIKGIDTDDDDDGGIDCGGGNDDEKNESEQDKFTKCEKVYLILMDRLAENINTSSREECVLPSSIAATTTTTTSNDAILCIKLMIEYVGLLHPTFVEISEIGKLVKKVKEFYDKSMYQEVQLQCKLLSKHMKRVYKTKKSGVPPNFNPTMMEQGCFKRGENRIGEIYSKKFKTGNWKCMIVSYRYEADEKLYEAVYTDGDVDELEENEINPLGYIAHFCMAPSKALSGKETMESGKLRMLRNLPACLICKNRDNDTLRIPVQCTAGDSCEYEPFKKYHLTLNKEKITNPKKFEGCGRTLHVGCARWGNINTYAKRDDKNLRLCYYFAGKTPTYVGTSNYTDPVANCFCRVHAIEIHDGLKEDMDSAIPKKQQPTLHVRNDVITESAEIARMKKRRRILMESEDEDDD